MLALLPALFNYFSLCNISSLITLIKFLNSYPKIISSSSNTYNILYPLKYNFMCSYFQLPLQFSSSIYGSVTKVINPVSLNKCPVNLFRLPIIVLHKFLLSTITSRIRSLLTFSSHFIFNILLYHHLKNAFVFVYKLLLFSSFPIFTPQCSKHNYRNSFLIYNLVFNYNKFFCLKTPFCFALFFFLYLFCFVYRL